MQNDHFYKETPEDQIWWIDNADEAKGERLFSFGKKKVFNLFSDYPHQLTPEQKEILDRENPYRADFFKDRQSAYLHGLCAADSDVVY
jgi:hypothetical protein